MTVFFKTLQDLTAGETGSTALDEKYFAIESEAGEKKLEDT